MVVAVFFMKEKSVAPPEYQEGLNRPSA